MSKRRVHYVLSSHWDREWYQVFQDFRYRLVRLFEQIIAGFATNHLKGPFVTDGQSIVLEDYLEIMPHRRQILEKLLQEKKIIAGPWYVLPDEFLVSGESLIRNLRTGRQLARHLGGTPSNAGFICDSFGHNSQMPQIFSGFGIKMAFVWRGINRQEPAHFIWQSPDGTRIIAYRFGRFGYSDIATSVRGAAEHYAKPDKDEIRRQLIETTIVEAKRNVVSAILRFDGQDHNHWDQSFYSVLLNAVQEGHETFEFIHSSLDDYILEVMSESDKIQEIVCGELREVAFSNLDKDSHWLIHGTGSSRIVLKQQNHKCEMLLCYWAEPWTAIADILPSFAYHQGFIDTSWKWLLQNHPHDSICGCSIDEVHKDMEFRFRQSASISERLTAESLEAVAMEISRDSLTKDADYLRVVVFNPLFEQINGLVEMSLDIPAEWPLGSELFGYEDLAVFRIYDAEGNELAYQKLSQEMNRPCLKVFADKHPLAKKVHRVRICLRLCIPALGYTTLKALPAVKVKGAWEGWVTVPIRYNQTPTLAFSDTGMENPYLKVTINPNGSYDILDKQSGNIYSNLGIMEDSSDIGDGWYYSSASNDSVLSSAGCSSDIHLIENGSLQCAFKVIQRMNVPESFDFRQMKRSDKKTELVFETELTLRQDADYLEVKTTVYNNARDHRVRVLFNSGAAATTYFSDSPFDVVERKIGFVDNYHLYRELDTETKPQQNWIAVFGGARGLAVISPGQYESAVRDNKARQIALTLFRSFRKTFLTSGQEGCQLLQPLSFHYLIKPLVDKPDFVDLFLLSQRLSCGFRTVQHTKQELDYLPLSAINLPLTAGFVKLTGRAVVTSMRKQEDRIEMRMFNPEKSSEEVEVRFVNDVFRRKCKTAYFVDFESKKISPSYHLMDGVFRFLLEPKKIKTISFG